MRSSVINNERGSVISDNDYGTNDYDYSNSGNGEKGRKEGCGATLPNTLTHSLTPSHFISLNTIYHLLNHNILFLHHNYYFCSLDNQIADDDH